MERVRQTPLPPPGKDTMGYDQQAGGTHPTGMHTCFTCFIFSILFAWCKCTQTYRIILH